MLEEIHTYGLTTLPIGHHYNTTRTPSLSVTMVYEDNAACIVLAHSEGTKMRTKHIALKWHHFRDQTKTGQIKLIKVDTNFNWADILTKPLTRSKHEALHKMIMGW
jgi:hypothetical protein